MYLAALLATLDVVASVPTGRAAAAPASSSVAGGLESSDLLVAALTCLACLAVAAAHTAEMTASRAPPPATGRRG